MMIVLQYFGAISRVYSHTGLPFFYPSCDITSAAASSTQLPHNAAMASVTLSYASLVLLIRDASSRLAWTSISLSSIVPFIPQPYPSFCDEGPVTPPLFTSTSLLTVLSTTTTTITITTTSTNITSTCCPIHLTLFMYHRTNTYLTYMTKTLKR